MGAAKDVGILCDEATYLCVKDVLVCQELAPVRVKGKRKLVKIYRPHPMTAMSEVAALSTHSSVCLLWQAARLLFHTAQCSFCTVVGGHGVLGKCTRSQLCAAEDCSLPTRSTPLKNRGQHGSKSRGGGVSKWRAFVCGRSSRIRKGLWSIHALLTRHLCSSAVQVVASGLSTVRHS